jgi:hypothetical protein
MPGLFSQGALVPPFLQLFSTIAALNNWKAPPCHHIMQTQVCHNMQRQ